MFIKYFLKDTSSYNFTGKIKPSNKNINLGITLESHSSHSSDLE